MRFHWTQVYASHTSLTLKHSRSHLHPVFHTGAVVRIYLDNSLPSQPSPAQPSTLTTLPFVSLAPIRHWVYLLFYPILVSDLSPFILTVQTFSLFSLFHLMFLSLIQPFVSIPKQSANVDVFPADLKCQDVSTVLFNIIIIYHLYLFLLTCIYLYTFRDT